MNAATERFSCTRDAAARGEPLHATASTYRRWLVLEQAGPWGRDAVPDSRIGERTGSALKRLARSLRARIILVRRHGRPDDVSEGHRLYVAYTGPEDPWLERFDLARPADVLDLDLADLREGRRCGGSPVDEPLYLVCTNGRHDACCAEYGRPLAATLARLRPERSWECSHIGGDRFAANLLCLPHGLYYGRVSEVDAEAVVIAYEDGRVYLDRYRGRSCYPFHVQAVDHAIRTAEGLDRIDELRLVDPGSPGGGLARVVLDAADGRRFTVDIRIQPDPVGRLLTCRSEARACPPRYEVVRLDVNAG
jgi:hypothetical protein